MNSAIVIGGKGMVGNATRHVFGIEKFIDIEESTSSYKEAGSLKYVFICLPTPTLPNGESDTTLIKEAISAVLSHQVGQPIFIIRSTVLPGTCKYLCDHFGITSIVHNPEFLSEVTWKKDVEHPDIVVIGGENNVYMDDVEALYKGRFKGLNIIKTNTVTSETIKYAVNTFYATKVVFANQIYDYSQRVGANYETIKKTMYARKWIGKNHLDIFRDAQRGAGGKCLKKDLQAFARQSQLPLLKVVNDLNTNYLG